MLTMIAVLAFTPPKAFAPRGASHAIRMQQDPPPPELDPRQAAFMKQRGFVWNAKSRSWAKGDPNRAQRLECRSGARVLRWDGTASVDETRLSCVRRATNRFEAALREAREAALEGREVDRRISLQLKDRIAKPAAPFVWLAVQALCLVSLASSAASHEFSVGVASLGIGVGFAPLLSTLRRERWRRLPGVEDGDGAIERLLVDAQCGSYALPGPWEWRASEPLRWGMAACATESLASLNMVLFWHSGVEQAVVATAEPTLGEGAAVALGVLAVALGGTGRQAYFYDGVRDGIPAELETASRLAATAETYYGMTAPSAGEAEASATATKLLAGAWTSKFDAVADGSGEASLLALAFVQAALCALSWELAGRSVVAPALALALAASDVYVLRPDTEQTRVTLPLDASRSMSL